MVINSLDPITTTLEIGPPERTFGETHNALVMTLSGQHCKIMSHYEFRAKSRKWKWFWYDLIGKPAKWLHDKLTPVSYDTYTMSVRLKQEEMDKLFNCVQGCYDNAHGHRNSSGNSLLPAGV